MSPELERVIGKAVIDTDFRKKLLDNPDEAIKGEGIELKDDELDLVRKAAKERAQNLDATNKALDTAAGSAWM
ncbi:MAG: Franean1_4349 family RiPP [Oscillochloris sp.]|nr:Franean1_4349 family RiPP [Oscillochloris sp.]